MCPKSCSGAVGFLGKVRSVLVFTGRNVPGKPPRKLFYKRRFSRSVGKWAVRLPSLRVNADFLVGGADS
jgi:hypothetical protein